MLRRFPNRPGELMIDETVTDATALEFGRFLKDVRESRGFSLRDVERITERKISNPYLSQLEKGKIAKPSALMLHRLSAVYAIDYGALLERAGIITDAEAPVNRVATSVFGELTSHEEDELLSYLSFIRSRKK
ncbi:helix-turn-helix transcriptional regulator [Brevundimonas sp. 3P9-tot-E]|jgi:HTH-type transcriptional regulator, competence development regulator|uniref:helix-turn-helix domain-containing protein n=2 Tax=Brevundimonas TaxID=41275 RepID=UPI0039A0693A